MFKFTEFTGKVELPSFSTPSHDRLGHAAVTISKFQWLETQTLFLISIPTMTWRSIQSTTLLPMAFHFRPLCSLAPLFRHEEFLHDHACKGRRCGKLPTASSMVVLVSDPDFFHSHFIAQSKLYCCISFKGAGHVTFPDPGKGENRKPS